MPQEHASFLHDEGYVVDGHPMKLFSMSWPISVCYPKFQNKFIEMDLPVRLVVSTPIKMTLDGIVNGVLTHDNLRIGNNDVICEKIEAKNIVITSNKITVNTLSPITCYTTMNRPDGRKYTVYFSPYEKDFTFSVNKNLVRKFQALYPDKDIPQQSVKVVALGTPKEQVAKFTDSNPFPTKGWSGKFVLSGPKELLQVAIDCGLGAKNSSGWGCVDVVQR